MTPVQFEVAAGQLLQVLCHMTSVQFKVAAGQRLQVLLS
jgi:hypothetical protein